MGLLSASPSPAAVSSTVDKPKPSTDGAFEAPDRNARVHCWQARDAFFECLEQNSIIDSIKDAERAQRKCGEQSRHFEKECAKSWVWFSLHHVLSRSSIFLPHIRLGFREIRKKREGEWEWRWEVRVLRRTDWNTYVANMGMTGYQQVTYFKQRRVMEFNKQKTLEKLRNEGVKGVPKDFAPRGIQGKPTWRPRKGGGKKCILCGPSHQGEEELYFTICIWMAAAGRRIIILIQSMHIWIPAYGEAGQGFFYHRRMYDLMTSEASIPNICW